MKIVIIGGTGLIGSQLTHLLKDQHEVVVASPNTGVNTLTGEGLAKALEKAQVVVDVSNSPSFETDAVMHFFKTSNENLMAAEKEANVKHHIALSVVGTQKLQGSGYFRAKQVQEDLIKASGIPYTIVHATQFFEFAGGILGMSTKGNKAYLSDAYIQPIASAEVAAFLASIVTANPALSTLEIAGPQKFHMNEWIKTYATITQKTIEIITQKEAPYSGAILEENTLVPGKAYFSGRTNYADWIAKVENQK